jgi:hypothetical protein
MSRQALGTDHFKNLGVNGYSIEDTAIDPKKFNYSFVLDGHCFTADAVTTDALVDEAVDERHLKERPVTCDKVAPEAVLWHHVKEKAIDTHHIIGGFDKDFNLVAGVVSENKIEDGAVNGDHLVWLSVYDDNFVEPDRENNDFPLKSEHLSNYDPEYDKKNPVYNSATVVEDKINDGAITSDKIADGAITSDKISAGAVTRTKIASEAVTGSKIKDGAVSNRVLSSARRTPQGEDLVAVRTDQLYGKREPIPGSADHRYNGAVKLTHLAQDVLDFIKDPLRHLLLILEATEQT